MTMDSLSNSIAATSRWIAAARACESERGNRLFNDPLASVLAGPEGFAWLDLMKFTAGSGAPELYPVIRTRFFDDFLLDACKKQGISQVVLLAAGLDTRAFRLDWPSQTRVYEIDLPEVLELKEATLKQSGVQASCERHAIPTDLKQNTWPEALLAAGYQPQISSVWLIEGLVFYLPRAAVHTLLEKISAQAAAGSLLGLDVMNLGLFLSPLAWPQQLALTWQGTPGRFGTDHPETLLFNHGWVSTITQPGEEGANFGRWPKLRLPWWYPGLPRSFLIKAHRL